MGAGTTVGDRVRKDLSEISNKPNIPTTKTIVSASRKKIHRRSKKALISPVQKLFETCKKVFANGKSGAVPSQVHINMLRAVLGKLRNYPFGNMSELCLNLRCFCLFCI